MNQTKKKIVYVITKSNFGGAQRYVFELATSLPISDYEVTVAFGGSGVLKEKLESAGIRTITIRSLERDISILKELRSLREFWRLYQSERPDVVHLNSSKAGGSGALVARLCGIKNIIYTAHGWAFWEPRPLLWRILVWFASWATAFLCHQIILVSHYEYRHTRMPFISKKLRVIHTALPDIIFKDREVSRGHLFEEGTCKKHKGDIWLITNAELNRNKNLFTAIEAVIAYNKTAEQKIFYSIMGSGELKNALQTYIKKHGGENYIEILGYVHNAREYLKAFDLFLLPSKKEGMPYAVLEAGAAGLPVIASRVGGIPEIIEHQKNGLLIDPNDTSTLVHALKQLVDDSDLRTRLGRALAEKVETHFSFEHMLSATRRVYEMR